MMITAKRPQEIVCPVVDASGEPAKPVEKEGWVEFTYIYIYRYLEREIRYIIDARFDVLSKRGSNMTAL